jgi:hypothetical protein
MTVGLYDPATGTFYLRNVHAGGKADKTFRYGPQGRDWQPLSGDWDGSVGKKPVYGQLNFEEMTSIAGVSRVGGSFGSAWGDFNGDGLPDLYSNNHATSPSLYLNTGSGTFINAARAIFPKGTIFNQEENALGDTHGAAWADFDNDGDQDLIELVGAQFGRGSGPNHLYRNTGEKFKDEAELLGISYPRGRGRSPLWLDWDNDGRLDVFLANAGREIAPSALFRQTDNGFVDVSQDVGLRAHPAAPVNRADSVHLSDLTGDGRMDLLIVSHWNPRLIYLYDMSSVPFIEKASQLNLLPPPPGIRGAIVADFNNDLLPDVFLMTRKSNSRAAPNKLLLNTGSAFVDAAGLAGLDAPTSCQRGVAADFDNDMDLDLYLICTTISNNLPNLLYENVGDAVFVPVSEAGGATGSTKGIGDNVAVADYDADGFLDLFISNGATVSGPNQLFHNLGNNHPWIEIDLEGVESNRDGIGARVLASAGGVTQLREQNGGMGISAQNHQRIHFGLGKNERVQLTVYWPSGKKQVVGETQADQIIEVIESAD